MIQEELELIEQLTNKNAELNSKIKKLEAKLALSNSAFLNIIAKSIDGIVILDRHKTVVFTNYAAINLFDRNIADLLGEPLDIDLNSGFVSEMTIPHAGGSISIVEVSIIETEWNNEQSYLVSFRDITKRKKSEELLHYTAQHDSLTNLHNRAYFDQQLSHSIQKSKESGQYMALIYVDLDDFKIVNDTFGHTVGDLLLVAVSNVLNQNIRQGDTAARLGGDEFALVLYSLEKKEYAAIIAQKILKLLNNTFNLNGTQIHITASIGIAVYPTSGITSTDLIKYADEAMYAAKKGGKNQIK